MTSGATPSSPTAGREIGSPEAALEWLEKAETKIVPPPFDDSSVEEGFLVDYRLAGLQSVAIACSLGIAAYVAIGTVDILSAGWNSEPALRRAIAVSLLAFVVLLILKKPRLVLENYSLLLGSIGAITIVGLISVIHLLRDDDVTALVNPVSLLALWILFGFVRLPLNVAISVGAIGSLFSMFGSRLTNMQEPGIRTLIYLVVANAIGILLARSIEIRERKLFLQRLLAERAQAELTRRTADAENASAEKTRLLAAVAHDLRQPMLAGVLHSEVLRQRLDAGDLSAVRKQAARVEASVKALGDTLEHLLVAARYDAENDGILVERVSLAKLFHRLRDVFESHADSKGIVLRIHEPDFRFAVRTNEQALSRILMNLVSNAIKFTGPREERVSGVVVRAVQRGESYRIAVVDTGAGISPSHLASIWQPFYQIGNEERNRSKGLGLGLYIVQQSLRKLEGHSVSVRSRLGFGSRFILEVPCYREVHLEQDNADSEFEYAQCSEGDLSSSLVSGLHVVLVEDDSEAREAIEAQLAEWNISCISGVGAEGVAQRALSDGRAVDWIIADFRLPGDLHGIDVIREVRRTLGYAPPALLVSAEVDGDKLLTMLPPSTVFIPKPFDAVKLKLALLSAPVPYGIKSSSQ